QIRMHLEHIASAFGSGDFDIPMFVHDQTPPGVDVMKKLRKKMFYKVQFTDAGGRVVIGTANPKARQAIWDFLRFQIREHKTGDPLEFCRFVPELSLCSRLFWGFAFDFVFPLLFSASPCLRGDPCFLLWLGHAVPKVFLLTRFLPIRST